MDLAEALRWWAVFAVYGLCALPVCILLFRSFADRGYGLSRIIGYLASSYLVFVLGVAHLLPFTLPTVLLSLAVIVAAEALLLVLRPDLRQEVFSVLRSGSFWAHAIPEELLFLLLLLFWAYLRGRNPDLNTLEKYMNIGFINSMLNTDFMPAKDMWAAGLNINYYYFGHFCSACAIRLSGLASDIGYNLMMATLFAGTFTGVFSSVYSLLRTHARRHRLLAAFGGTLSGVMVCLSGNLHYFVYHIARDFLRNLGIPMEEYTYWFADATRYIGYRPPVEHDLTITEFPLYSFIVSDLHAHVMDLLPVLLLIALAAVFVIEGYRTRATAAERPLSRLFVPSPVLIAMGVLIGVFSMTNFWDFPIYMVVSLFLFCYVAWLRYRFTRRFFLEVAYEMALLFAVKYLTSLPFDIGFEAMFSGIGLVTTRSRFYQLLVLHGGGLFFFAVFALWLFLFRGGREEPRKKALPAAKEELSATAPRFSLARFTPADIFVLILCICGFGLAFGTEFVFVKDIYIDNYPRANTMFKLSYQSFLLFNLSIGYIVFRIVDQRRRLWRSGLALVGMLCVCTMLLSYAGNAIPAWYGSFSTAETYQGLGGFDFIKDYDVLLLEDGTELYPEADAVDWVRENTPKDAVVLEVHGESYGERCFLSVATGRQTVVGWETHEWLWRNGYGFVADRKAEVDTVYTSTDPAATRAVIEKYGISYIHIGHFEKEEYADTIAYDTLYTLADIVFEEGDVQILKVK